MSLEARSQEITRLLVDWSQGDRQALAQLTPLIYDELRYLAKSSFRGERQDHTLQATALVHETYMRLIDQKQVHWKNRAHFFAIAARMMRRILVDHARSHLASKRGSGHRLELDEGHAFSEERDVDLIALDQTLERLAEFDPRQSRLVELRFFGGLTIDETAEVLDISPATVKREWDVAKAWLFGQLASR
ncbi:MAG: sigma-70 family RNA polymerase sigma factor [Acidobacteriota bacterium]